MLLSLNESIVKKHNKYLKEILDYYNLSDIKINSIS